MSERLGHTTMAFTLDTYTSALPAIDKSAAEVDVMLADRELDLGPSNRC